jgi:hypothetical protein
MTVVRVDVTTAERKVARDEQNKDNDDGERKGM